MIGERTLRAVLVLVAAYHVVTGEAKSEGRGWGDTAAIAFGAVGAAWLARVSERINRENTPQGGTG